jgi:hypothetical protein
VNHILKDLENSFSLKYFQRFLYSRALIQHHSKEKDDTFLPMEYMVLYFVSYYSFTSLTFILYFENIDINRYNPDGCLRTPEGFEEATSINLNVYPLYDIYIVENTTTIVKNDIKPIVEIC